MLDDKNNAHLLPSKQLPSLENWENLDTTLPIIFSEHQNDVIRESAAIYLPISKLMDIENINLDLRNKNNEDEILRVFNPKFQIVVGAAF